MEENKMKKDTLLEIIFGTVGGLVFAIGMCMCLIPEWNMFNTGVVVSIIGFLILLIPIGIYLAVNGNLIECINSAYLNIMRRI